LKPKNSPKGAKKDFEWRKLALLAAFGELLGFEVPSKLNFWGILALFFQKYILWRVCKKLLSKKYGRAFSTVPHKRFSAVFEALCTVFCAFWSFQAKFSSPLAWEMQSDRSK